MKTDKYELIVTYIIENHQKFYLNGNGQPVLVFEKYTIAPGAMGTVEFVVTP